VPEPTNPFLENLSAIGSLLAAPGDYTRGLLAGQPGDRVGGGELLAALGLLDAGDDSVLGKALGFGANVLTDPLTYAGAALGALGSRGAYKALGPMHPGGAEKVFAAGDAVMQDLRADPLLSEVLASPQARAVLQEIPEGSTYLPGGSSALPFRTPAGDVVRIAPPLEDARLAIPEMLQPTRNVTHGPFRVERLPWAENVGDRALFDEAAGPLSEAIRARGLDPADMHPGNIGLVNGRPMVIDSGAVGMLPGGPEAVAPEMIGPTPARMLYPGMLGGAAMSPLSQLLLGQ